MSRVYGRPCPSYWSSLRGGRRRRRQPSVKPGRRRRRRRRARADGRRGRSMAERVAIDRMAAQPARPSLRPSIRLSVPPFAACCSAKWERAGSRGGRRTAGEGRGVGGRRRGRRRDGPSKGDAVFAVSVRARVCAHVGYDAALHLNRCCRRLQRQQRTAARTHVHITLRMCDLSYARHLWRTLTRQSKNNLWTGRENDHSVGSFSAPLIYYNRILGPR